MKVEKVKEAHDELKEYIVKGLFNFTNKHCSPGSELYPNALYIMKSCLIEALEEVNYQLGGNRVAAFTRDQQDHICFQIGEWYLNWRDVLMNWDERTHRLGFAKEELKRMICGD